MRLLWGAVLLMGSSCAVMDVMFGSPGGRHYQQDRGGGCVCRYESCDAFNDYTMCLGAGGGPQACQAQADSIRNACTRRYSECLARC